jgi:quercetin dioxygenase-like cupin family protein
MSRTVPQPVTVDIKLTNDLFIKTMSIAEVGSIIPQHSHKYDHVSLLAVGSVRVQANGDMLGDYHAPVGILIRSGVKHTFLTLTPGVVIACIHALHGTAGIEIEEEHELEGE